MTARPARRITILLTSMLFVAGALNVATAAPASAAGCWSSGCTGQNPVTMGCADSRTYTMESFNAGFLVELRYSPTCNAIWAKATGVSSSYYRAAVYGYNSRYDRYPSRVYATGTPTRDGTYSLMVGFNYWVSACREYYASGWSTQQCTGRH